MSNINDNISNASKNLTTKILPSCKISFDDTKNTIRFTPIDGPVEEYNLNKLVSSSISLPKTFGTNAPITLTLLFDSDVKNEKKKVEIVLMHPFDRHAEYVVQRIKNMHGTNEITKKCDSSPPRTTPSQPRPIVSYPATVEICRNLPYAMRVHISTVSSALRKIHTRLDFSIKSLKLHQKIGDVDPESDTGEIRENPDAWLRISNDKNAIDYVFIWNEASRQMEILCSLTPEKSIFIAEKRAAQMFFEYFLQKSKNPIEHVELVECDKPFRNLSNLQIPSLRWVCNKGNDEERFAGFPSDYVFEKLELENIRLYLLTEPQVQKAKHLIIRNFELYEEFTDGQETTNMIHFFGRLRNQLVHAEFRLSHFSTFCMGCDVLLRNNLQLGSKYTGHFDEAVEHPLEEMRRLLEVEVETGKVDGKECFILKKNEEDDFIVAVFHSSIDLKESFTAVKCEIPAKIE